MDQNNHNSSSALTTTRDYVDRVFSNEAAKKGIAAAGAGLLVAAITELLWPSR